MNLPNRIGHIEKREQAGGVPGRPRSEFFALNKKAIGTTALDQTVECSGTDHAATDHNYVRFSFHLIVSGAGTNRSTCSLTDDYDWESYRLTGTRRALAEDRHCAASPYAFVKPQPPIMRHRLPGVCHEAEKAE